MRMPSKEADLLRIGIYPQRNQQQQEWKSKETKKKNNLVQSTLFKERQNKYQKNIPETGEKTFPQRPSAPQSIQQKYGKSEL